MTLPKFSFDNVTEIKTLCIQYIAIYQETQELSRPLLLVMYQ